MSDDIAPTEHPPHPQRSALSAAQPLLTAWLETLPEPHVLFDRHYRILAANAAYRHTFGQDASVLGRTCYAVSHHSPVPCDQAGELCPLARAQYSGQRERVLHLHHTSRGEEYVQIELQPLRIGAGIAEYFLEKIEPLPTGQTGPGEQVMLGRAPAFRAVLELIARVGPSNTCVLLQGETGSGKELAARALHAASARADHPLVVVDCAGLSEALLEAELFGQSSGRGPAAPPARTGLVEMAHGGTLLLDEVGDMPWGVQAKLLRLLDSGTYRRPGHTELRRADVRIIASTHRPLHQLAREGRLRQDLYHRLNAFPITLPPLRERSQDIGLLAQDLLQRLAPGRRLGLAPTALRQLQQQPWPGNVRELRNVLERAILLTDGPTISAATIGQAIGLDVDAGATLHPPLPAPRTRLRALEQEALRHALQPTNGTRQQQAQALGISPRTLYRRLKALEQ